MVTREELSYHKAIEIFKNLNEDYKLEIISEIDKEDTISAYRQGEFIDLCRGPHVPNTKNIKFFKLLSTAGAYWRGDSNNNMMTRIYAWAYETKKSYKKKLRPMKRPSKEIIKN